MPRARRGLTLLELLVTITIVTILMSLGLGVLSRLSARNRVEATRGGIRALLRMARNASLQERYGATVTIDPENSQVSAQLKTNLTGFRFEPTEVTGGVPKDPGEEDEPVRFELTGIKDFTLQVEDGALYDPGRTGSGLLFARPEAWAWLDDAPILQPRDGLYVEISVLLGDLQETLYEHPPRHPPDPRYERAGEPALPFAQRALDFDPRDPPRYHVVRRGRAWALAVTANYEVEVSLSGTDELGAPTVWVARTKPETLRPNVWFRLALAFDGGPRPRLLVDGVPRALYPLDQRNVPHRLDEDTAPITLSDSHPDRGFFGVLDELRLAALVHSEAIDVPQDVALIAPQSQISFDMLGQLDPAKHPAAVTFYISDDPRALALLAGPPPQQTEGTITQEAYARQQAKNLGLDAQRVAAFQELLPQLPDGSWAELTVERTGLVR